MLKDQKNLYLNKMFISQQGDVQLRFKGFIEPWEQRELKEIGEDYSGLSGKTKKDFGHGESLYVPYKNIFNNHIVDVNNLEKVNVKNKQNEVKYGDIFFTISSEIPEEVGMSSVMIENIKDLYLNSFSFGFRPHTETDLDVVFSSYLFRTPTFRKKMYILAQGISRYNISKTNVMKLEIALPSINEQKKIGKMMYRLDSMITLHNKKLNKLESLKKEYLNYLFI
ncbi:restriction endonuclease subunit S [Nosocomiicoccus ampullae]